MVAVPYISQLPWGLPARSSQAQSPPSLHKYLLREDASQALARLFKFKMTKTDPEPASPPPAELTTGGGAITIQGVGCHDGEGSRLSGMPDGRKSGKSNTS